MRTFKIIVIMIVLLVGAGLILVGIYGSLPDAFGPGDEIDEIYNEEDRELDEDDIYSREMKQYQGTVKLLGVSIYMEGSHRLEEDDKLIALLESEDINLPDFEGKEVKVRGFVRDTVEGGQKIMDVAFIEIIDEAGVKAFSEAGYEFSFSYPADWIVEKEADKVTWKRKVNEKEENLMIVYQFENVKVSLENWLADRDQNLFYEEKQIKVGSLSGVQRVVKNGDQEIVKSYVKEGNNAYEIRLVSQDEVIRNQYFSIVDFFKTNFEVDEEELIDEAMEEEEEPIDEEEPSEEPTEDEAMEEEPAEDPTEETDEEPTEEEASDLSFTDLEPLSQSDIDRVLDRGFSPFEGRSLSFDYPKVWYFLYLGGGKYGFTDSDSYKANEEEVTEEISRVLLIAGMVDVSCNYKKTRSVEGTTYTLCTREPGLNEIADHIAESISK